MLAAKHIADRIPPHNLEAEMAMLGSILVDREMMGTISDIVQSADFYAHVHETIFSVLDDLYNHGEPLDKVTVSEELRRRDALEKVGGISYLSALMDTVQSAASARYYATIVREKAVLRGLIHAGTRITALGYEGEEDVSAAVDSSERLVLSVDDRGTGEEAADMRAVAKRAFEALSNPDNSRGLQTGFRDFDEMTTGLRPGQFIIVAGRPGMGKTSWGLGAAIGMATQAAAEDRGAIALFSLEMSESEISERFIAALGGIDLHYLRGGNFRSEAWDTIGSALGRLVELPIALDDSGALSVSQIRSRARRIKSKRGLAAIVVDYLQLVGPSVASRGSRSASNRNEEVSDVCRTLKATAKELKVPVIALCQLNRNVELRNDKRPMLADLRDSGSIEQEADLVAFLYREGYYNKECADPALTECIISKHRSGPTGTTQYRFVQAFTRFESLTGA
jgi:replicative DNA helicase